MDSARWTPRRASFPDGAVESTDTSRGEVGGDKVNGQRPTIQWPTGLYDASSSWLCLCLAWRALTQGGEPILAASMSKTGPGEELRLHGMRRSPALVVSRGGGQARAGLGQRLAPWSGWPSWEASMAREAIHHLHISVGAALWPLNPLLASSVSSSPDATSKGRRRRDGGTGGRGDGDLTPSSVDGHDDEPPVATTRSARGSRDMRLGHYRPVSTPTLLSHLDRRSEPIIH